MCFPIGFRCQFEWMEPPEAHEKRTVCIGHYINPIKFQNIGICGFRGADLRKMANQKLKCPLTAIFFNQGEPKVDLKGNVFPHRFSMPIWVAAATCWATWGIQKEDHLWSALWSLTLSSFKHWHLSFQRSWSLKSLNVLCVPSCLIMGNQKWTFCKSSCIHHLGPIWLKLFKGFSCWAKCEVYEKWWYKLTGTVVPGELKMNYSPVYMELLKEFWSYSKIKCFAGCCLIWPKRLNPKHLGQFWHSSLISLLIFYCNKILSQDKQCSLFSGLFFINGSSQKP